MPEQHESSAHSAELEIICRNCKAKFVVPEQAVAQKDFPCPDCSFINQAQPPGKLSRANLLAKIGKIVGDEPEIDEHSAYNARVKGGIALLLAIVAAVIYSYLYTP